MPIKTDRQKARDREKARRKALAAPAADPIAKPVAEPVKTTRPSRRKPEKAPAPTPGKPTSTPLPQPKREEERLEEIESFSGPGAVKSVEELNLLRAQQNQQLRDGDIDASGVMTQEQFNAAKAQLEGGAVGVNPMAFGGEGARRTEDDELELLPVGSPRQGETERAPAGAPLRSPEARAGGAPTTTREQGADLRQQLGEIDPDRLKQEVDPNTGDLESLTDLQRRKTAMEARRTEIKKQLSILDKTESDRLDRASKETKQEPMQALTEIDTSIAKLEGLTAQEMGVRQDVFNAYLPNINRMLTSLQTKRTQAEEIDTRAERAAIAEQEIQPTIDLAIRRERQLQDRLAEDQRILKENRDIVLEANRLSADALNLDKQIFEEEAKINEVKQMAINVEGEKRLRRNLNALGIENSPKSVVFLQEKIQSAADALTSMITTNNLQSLKFANARDQLNNGIRGALSEYDSKRAILNAKFDDNIFKLDEYISGARSEVLEDLENDYEKLIESEDALNIEYANKVEAMTIKSLEMDATHRKETEGAKNDAWSNMIDAFKTFPGGSSIRQLAIDNANEAGWDISQIDINDETIGATAKSEKRERDKKIAGLMGQMMDEGKDVGLLAANALGGGKRSYRQSISEAEIMQNIIDNDDLEGMKSQILITARNSLKASELKDVNGAKDILTDLKTVYSTINAFDDRFGGIYKDAIEGGKTWADVLKDEKWIELWAQTGGLQADLRNKYAGVAVTDTELKFLNQFLISKEDKVRDMKIKLKEMEENAKLIMQNRYDDLMGEGAYHYLTGEGLPELMSSEDDWSVRHNTVESKDAYFDGIFGDESSMLNADGVVTGGTITAKGSDVWEWGLDVAAPRGTPVRSPKDGKVVSVVSEFNNPKDKPLDRETGKSQNKGFGNMVIVEYGDGVTIQYSHLQNTGVKEGDKITMNSALGSVGNTGITLGKTGVHTDITGKNADGTFMTPDEVLDWLSGRTVLASAN